MGLRYSVTEAWYAGSGIQMDYWPGNRASVAWTVNGGFAFDLEGLF
jgi:hypothetical protein